MSRTSGVDDTEPSDTPALPADVERGRDDGPLDSIGKAIAAPIAGAAEDDEPDAAGTRPPVPPG